MKTTKQILTEAKALVEKGWTKGAFAKNAQGKMCSAYDENATSFCAWGAITRASDSRVHDKRKAVDQLGQHVPRAYMTIDRWNDAPERTLSEVLATFDKAIEAAE